MSFAPYLHFSFNVVIILGHSSNQLERNNKESVYVLKWPNDNCTPVYCRWNTVMPNWTPGNCMVSGKCKMLLYEWPTSIIGIGFCVPSSSEPLHIYKYHILLGLNMALAFSLLRLSFKYYIYE